MPLPLPQVLVTLRFLGRLSIVHCDLKPGRKWVWGVRLMGISLNLHTLSTIDGREVGEPAGGSAQVGGRESPGDYGVWLLGGGSEGRAPPPGDPSPPPLYPHPRPLGCLSPMS